MNNTICQFPRHLVEVYYYIFWLFALAIQAVYIDIIKSKLIDLFLPENEFIYIFRRTIGLISC